MIREQYRRTAEKLLPVVAYGDAAGVPVETKSADYIAQHHGQIDQLISATDNMYFTGEWPAGSTSDDTQLTVAVIKALLRVGAFDLRAIADEHITAYHETPDVYIGDRIKKLGWGGSTTSSIRRIIDGVSPLESGHPEGTGNGILMKMGGLPLLQAAEGTEHRVRYNQYDQLTNMTHDTDIARITTRVHGDVLTHLMTNHYHPWTFVEDVVQIAEYHERQFRSTWDISNALLPLRSIARGRNVERHIREWSAEWAEQAGATTDQEIGKSYGFYAPQTLALAYGAFIDGTYGDNRRPDFEKTVYSAVNNGGDADSTASIAASMYNFAWKGNFTLPSDIEKLKNIDDLRTLSQKFGSFVANRYAA